MPINWKSQFETPLINLIHLNQVENSDQLVNKIAQFYDLAIKTGAPMAPGTPAGPLISGNIQGFKSSLKLYYKLQKVATVKTETGKYLQRISKLVELGKEIKLEISNINNELKSTKADKLSILNSVVKIKNSDSIELLLASMPEGHTKERIRKLGIKEVELKNKIINLENKLKRVVTDKINDLKKEIANFVKKLRPGGNEGSIKKRKFKGISDAKKITRQSLSSIKLIQAEIKDTALQINTISNSINSVNNITPADFNLILGITKQIITASYDKTLELITAVLVILGGYPDYIVSSNTKSKIRKDLAKIAEFKLKIQTKESEITSKYKNKIKKKINDIAKSLISSKNKKTNRIKEKINDSKRIQNIIKELNTIKKDAVFVINFIKVIKLIKSDIEKQQYKSGIHSTILLSEGTLSFIHKNDPVLYSKVSKNTTIIHIKSFIHDKEQELNGFLNKLKAREKKLLSFKDKVAQSIKDKLVNKQAIIFGIFVKLAIIRYWTGALCVNLGVVTFPGVVVTAPLRMIESEGPADTISQLSKVFQAHTKTVVGTYTTPAGVTVPWTGYF